MDLPEENLTNISQIIPRNNPPNKYEFMLHPTLDFINRILLEEDIDEQFGGYQEVAAHDLSNIEKPFYDILRENYPPLQNNEFISSHAGTNHIISTSISNDPITEEFQRGVEEGMKFLPAIKFNNLADDLNVSTLSLNTVHKNNAHGLVNKRKVKMSSTDADTNVLEGRNSKISTPHNEEIIRDEMFDRILLHGEENTRDEISHMRETMKCETSEKKKNKEEAIDLESLLIHCSEAVARNDREAAEKLIKEIRLKTSPFGSGAQRLACILTDGLEARMAGTGSETYHQIFNKRFPIRDVLKAYHLYIIASPILRVSYFFANQHIYKEAENASKIHIIDLGISFGFQWPPLIQALAKRKGGAPKLRITGVDLPQSGLQPDERIKQTGLRLEEYAKSFGVPFEYQSIASLWEHISLRDLKIQDDEVVIVNSMLRFRHVRDDTFPNSPRNQVLNLIKRIKPKAFILAILNAYFSPFFTARFKKVMLNYSTAFDMLDVIVPRDDEGRRVLERELLAAFVLNLVACEGVNWVERPETYKQWHGRIVRSGFEQMAMDRNIIEDCDAKVKNGYHEGFFIEEESGWLLLGWNGRINYGLSVWKPKPE